jgi:hypothetical protein
MCSGSDLLTRCTAHEGLKKYCIQNIRQFPSPRSTSQLLYFFFGISLTTFLERQRVAWSRGLLFLSLCGSCIFLCDDLVENSKQSYARIQVNNYRVFILNYPDSTWIRTKKGFPQRAGTLLASHGGPWSLQLQISV